MYFIRLYAFYILDVNFEEGSRLHIGPIGVDPKGSSWKPPQEWYEDEDEGEQGAGLEASYINLFDSLFLINR